MIERNKRATHYADWIFPILVIVILTIFASGGGLYYWLVVWQSPSAPPAQTRNYTQPSSEFSSVYTQLGIQPLPANVERQIQTQLTRLSREACYRDAIADLADALRKAGYPRESATSLRTFTQRCPNSEYLLAKAYDALDGIGDFAGALEVADQL